MAKKSISLTNGEVYFYLEHGSGKETLILLHGNLSSSFFYNEIMKTFTGYRVIAIDMRGFGDSTYNTPIISMKDLAIDLNLFMDRMDIDKAHILGWSAGGAVAMQFATMYPDKIDKLILKSTASYRGYPIYKKNEFNQPILGEFYSSKEEMAKDPVNVLPVYFMLMNQDSINMKIIYDLVIYNLKKPNKIEYQQQISEVLKQRNIIDFDWALTSFNLSGFTNGVTLGENEITKLKAPTLIMWGERDMTVLEYMIDETHEAIPQSKKVVFKDAGHSLIVDQPELFTDTIIEFLKE